MGADGDRGRQLASVNATVSHAGRTVIWDECGRASYDQFVFSPGQYLVAVFCFQKDDRLPMAKRHCCRFVCPSSAARGVGCLGVGTKRCLKRLFLAAYDGGLCPVCRAARENQIFNTAVVFCLRSYGKADAGDPAVCSTFNGLLASWPSGRPNDALGYYGTTRNRGTRRAYFTYGY